MHFTLKTILMRSFSEVTLVWHITADPVGKITGSWSSVTSFSVAVNRLFKTKTWENKEEVDFFDVTLWGIQATNSLKLLKKWDYVMVKGNLKNSSWTAQDWSKRYKTEIIAEDFYLLSSKKTDNNETAKTPVPELDFSDLEDVA